MKLLNLVSNSNISDITNVFSSNILIKEHSKIALTLASINLTNSNIEITDENRQFTFQLGVTQPERTVLIPLGLYNITSFVAALNAAFNSALDATGTYDLGFQWKVSNDANKLTIQFDRSDNTTVTYTDKVNVTNLLKTTSTNVYDAYCCSSKLFINGCGSYSCVVVDGGVPALDLGICFGLLRTRPTGVATLDPDQFEYGILIDGSEYKVMEKGIIMSTGVTYQSTYKLILRLTQGKLEFLVQTATTLVVLGTADWDFSTSNFYMGCSILKQNTGISNPKATANPYIANSELTLQEEHEMLGAYATRVTLSYNNAVKLLLGYLNNEYSKKLVRGSFPAELNVDRVTSSPSIALELTSLDTLESYEGRSGTRKSIIAVIPSLKITNDTIQYTPSVLLPIDVNNSYPYKINQIRLRIINYEDNTVVPLGPRGASITLVII